MTKILPLSNLRKVFAKQVKHRDLVAYQKYKSPLKCSMQLEATQILIFFCL